jgi:hypothetical protein
VKDLKKLIAAPKKGYKSAGVSGLDGKIMEP